MSKIITASKLNRLWKNGILPIKQKVEDLEANGGGNIVYLTQAEYDALPASKESDGVEYRITDAGTHINAARDWAYDNTESNLEATNVQDAIDEVNASVSGLNESLANLGSGTYYDEETEILYIQGGTPNYTYDSATGTLYLG